VFAETIHEIMSKDKRVVVVTAAMPEGYHLGSIASEFPDRVFDVGICEQHAVTFAAGMATQGLIPVVAIYSTFLQRGFDQLIHDVCLQDLPVVFALDRGGIVGEDGKTHQGSFDISYLSLIPGMIVAAPSDENELKQLLYTAVQSGHPMAVRYPRGYGRGITIDPNFQNIPIGQGRIMREGSDIAILALGNTVEASLEAAEILAENDIYPWVIDSRFAKPIDEELIVRIAQQVNTLVSVEENTLKGGFGSTIATVLESNEFKDVRLKMLGIPDEFIEHGNQEILRQKYNLDPNGIAREVIKFISSESEDLNITNTKPRRSITNV
jgi:1-deoxy-D-xylulose-5-phosphate synthase